VFKAPVLRDFTFDFQSFRDFSKIPVKTSQCPTLEPTAFLDASYSKGPFDLLNGCFPGKPIWTSIVIAQFSTSFQG
jgi:hypothetical protein